MTKQFSFHDTREILLRLSEARQESVGRAPKIVLIGGQSVNYWADRYREREAALGATFTSKDIDFQAESHEVDWVSGVLGVRALKPAQDHATEQTGKIVLTLADGGKCEIDFLRRSIPNDSEQVRDTAVDVPLDEQGTHTFPVMHPFLCMRSRAANVVKLSDKYDNEHGRAQLRASIRCLRYFVLEAAQSHRREALDVAKRIFAYARNDRDGRSVYRKHAIDPFDAVPHDQALGDGFFNQSYPRWRDELAAKRSAYRGIQ